MVTLECVKHRVQQMKSLTFLVTAVASSISLWKQNNSYNIRIYTYTKLFVSHLIFLSNNSIDLFPDLLQLKLAIYAGIVFYVINVYIGIACYIIAAVCKHGRLWCLYMDLGLFNKNTVATINIDFACT